VEEFLFAPLRMQKVDFVILSSGLMEKASSTIKEKTSGAAVSGVWLGRSPVSLDSEFVLDVY
jgi:hypothetical protein